MDDTLKIDGEVILEDIQAIDISEESQSNTTEIKSALDKPAKDKKPYPKNGDCHFRLTEYEWEILQGICEDRACKINEAIAHAIRRYRSRALDQEITVNKLMLIDGNLDDIYTYVKDIAHTGDELLELLNITNP